MGNRTSKTVTNGGSTVTNYTYDAANELTSVNGQAYTYDANGNLTSNGAKTFVYNEVNQLIQVKDPGNNVIASFTYDDAGKRISMTASGNTTYYHYSGDKVIYEADASHNITADYTYDAAGNPATMTRGGANYYYQLDGHGSVTALTDASGNTVAQYQYDAWGNILSQSGAMASVNPYRYSGYRYDEATGLYYLMARYYDAGVGRFISRDAVLSVNLYAYTENNPVNMIDPSGNITQAEVSAYKSGKLSQKAYDLLMTFTNYYIIAKSRGDKGGMSLYNAAANEFRASNYKANVITGNNGKGFTFEYWWGKKYYVDANTSNELAAIFSTQNGTATKIAALASIAALKYTVPGAIVGAAANYKAGQYSTVSGILWQASARGRGAVLTYKKLISSFSAYIL